MPTKNRPKFVEIALDLFQAQTYPRKELIIVDDSDVPLQDPGYPNVKLIRLEQGLTLGEKHNVAAGAAQGQFMAHWDDDDWFSPARLLKQATPIAEGRADVTGFAREDILMLPSGEFYRFKNGFPKGDRPVRFHFHDGTAVYHRRLWDYRIRYTPVNVGEKLDFIHLAWVYKFTLEEIPNQGDFIYTRHSRNAWQFPDSWMYRVGPSPHMNGMVAKFAEAAGG